MILKLLEIQAVEWYHKSLCYPGKTQTELSIANHFYRINKVTPYMKNIKLASF